ncbi:uncharacterized protein LOC128595711 isoform X2 [Nycticebus coucang]|uniref:uncharacterized protein LOC128595711 isoform X2 n=1 Tax=Nycticebus coucang TaxID=9470 RepID=UPI00234E0A45|nr:uncharacterized protein LOC128595711 isoform X2 [Nycticebus coucang]
MDRQMLRHRSCSLHSTGGEELGRGSPAAGPPGRSLLTEGWSWASKKKQLHLFWCHRRWLPLAFGLVTHQRSADPSAFFCVWKSFLKSAYSSSLPGAGGCTTTLPPSFFHADCTVTSSTTDSSRRKSFPMSKQDLYCYGTSSLTLGLTWLS